MKKIGILGGSFMPIHNGHIEMANTAYHELNLDEIWILPNGIPPYKRVTEEISVLSRLALIQAMIKSYPYMKICDYEVRKSSFQYSYETLSYFHEKYPDYELYFIIGEDEVSSILHCCSYESCSNIIYRYSKQIASLFNGRA